MHERLTLSSVDELRTVYRQPNKGSVDKEVHHLDTHCRDYIAHSPFAVLATSDGAGRIDISPKGGPPGFAAVLDDHHVSVPDMAGNNRIDSLRNIVRHPGVSLLFMIPGIGETLRVVGDCTVSVDPEVLKRTPLDDMVPNVALVVEVQTAFIHCAKALRRSGLWETERWPSTDDMATPACMFRDHMHLAEPMEAVDKWLDNAYATTTWAMGGTSGSGTKGG